MTMEHKVLSCQRILVRFLCTWWWLRTQFSPSLTVFAAAAMTTDNNNNNHYHFCSRRTALVWGITTVVAQQQQQTPCGGAHAAAWAAAVEEEDMNNTTPNASRTITTTRTPTFQPATRERPAIPLPQQQQQAGGKNQPLVQGVIYGPSDAVAAALRDFTLRVEIITTAVVQDDDNNNNDSPVVDVLQSSQIPMTQISFPFYFQFTKLSSSKMTTRTTNLLDGRDWVVRAAIVDNNNSINESKLCAFVQGQGVAKVLELPSGVVVRAPASVRLEFKPVDVWGFLSRCGAPQEES